MKELKDIAEAAKVGKRPFVPPDHPLHPRQTGGATSGDPPPDTA